MTSDVSERTTKLGERHASDQALEQPSHERKRFTITASFHANGLFVRPSVVPVSVRSARPWGTFSDCGIDIMSRKSL